MLRAGETPTSSVASHKTAGVLWYRTDADTSGGARSISGSRKKSEKSMKGDWRSKRMGAIVRALCFAGALCCGGPPKAASQESDRLREAQVSVKPAADTHTADEGELARVRRALEDMRGRYAALLLKNRELQKRIAALDWVAAEVLQAGGDPPELPSEARLLRELEDQRRRLRSLVADLTRWVRSAENDGLLASPDENAQRELERRLFALVDRSRKLAQLPPEVARRGGDHEARGVSVLVVDGELQAVVVDGGRRQGIAAGDRWQSATASPSGVVLQIVQTAEQFSVAVPVHGRLQTIGPGSKLMPYEGEARKSKTGPRE